MEGRKDLWWIIVVITVISLICVCFSLSDSSFCLVLCLSIFPALHVLRFDHHQGPRQIRSALSLRRTRRCPTHLGCHHREGRKSSWQGTDIAVVLALYPSCSLKNNILYQYVNNHLILLHFCHHVFDLSRYCNDHGMNGTNISFPRHDGSFMILLWFETPTPSMEEKLMPRNSQLVNSQYLI